MMFLCLHHRYKEGELRSFAFQVKGLSNLQAHHRATSPTDVYNTRYEFPKVVLLKIQTFYV